jgi:hypothetical protein
MLPETFLRAMHVLADSVWPAGTTGKLIRAKAIGHEGSVGLSVCKVHISATRWRLFTLTAVALRFCRATEKTPSSGGNKRRATAKSLNDLP